MPLSSGYLDEIDEEDDVNQMLRINADKHRDSSVSRNAIHSVLNELCARALPVAVTYANSGLAAAVATACSLALADRSAQAGKAFFVVQSR